MITNIANIVIPITDHERSIAFYRDTLGFTVTADFPMGPGGRWVEVSPGGAGTSVALAIPRGGMWGSVGGDTNISFGCPGIAEEHARLRDLGVDVDERVLDLGPQVPKMFRLRDPDGNIIQLIEA